MRNPKPIEGGRSRPVPPSRTLGKTDRAAGVCPDGLGSLVDSALHETAKWISFCRQKQEVAAKIKTQRALTGKSAWSRTSSGWMVVFLTKWNCSGTGWVARIVTGRSDFSTEFSAMIGGQLELTRK